jgi:hypothetical protein
MLNNNVYIILPRRVCTAMYTAMDNGLIRGSYLCKKYIPYQCVTSHLSMLICNMTYMLIQSLSFGGGSVSKSTIIHDYLIVIVEFKV